MARNKGSVFANAMLAIIALAVVGGVVGGAVWFNMAKQSAVDVDDGGTGTGVPVTLCPDDGDTSVKIQMFNQLNSTAEENRDVRGLLFKVLPDGTEEAFATITDTTSPSATTVDCGFEYVFRPVATDSNDGNNSRVLGIRSGSAEVVDGEIVFTAASSNVNIDAYMKKQAVLECRAYSNVDKGLMYDSGDASATDYETDGVTITSTTDNATAYTETNGVDITFTCRATNSAHDWNDFGTYLLLELPTSTWAEPTVWVDGQKLSDMKDTLNGDESKAWAGYEYVYFFDKPILDGGEGVEIRLAAELAAGQTSSSADPQLDISARGAYLATAGGAVKRGGVKDDASTTAVRSLYDLTFDVT